MDPDTEVKGPPGRLWPPPPRLATAGALVAVLAIGIGLRLARFHSGDYYEDGASHWWTAASALDRGVIVDPFGLNTAGWWLPGYDPLVASLMALAGTTDADLMRAVGLGSWVAACVCLFAIARPAGAPVALFACALFALSPFDILNTTVTTGVEPAVALMLAGFFLLRKAREGHPALLAGACAAFCVAVLLRYEAIVFVAVCLLHGWWWGGSSPLQSFYAKQERPYLLFALGVATAVLALTWGENFVSRLLTGPTPDYSYAETQGLVSMSPFTRGLSFWLVWGPIVAAAGALMLVGVALHLGRLETWLVVAFSVLLTIFLYMGLGTASFRYIAPVEPIMWVLAALALRRISRWPGYLAARLGHIGPTQVVRQATALSVGVAVLSASFGSASSAMAIADNQIALNGPLDRAAAYLGSLPQDDLLLVVVDSPVAAQASGLPAGRLIGSALLPGDRDAAMDFMRQHVQYVIAVNISYYPLLRLFPELALGRSNANFSLLFDASGWESQYTPKTAWVYEVNRDHAVVNVAPDLFLHVPTAPAAGSPDATGLRVVSGSVEITAGAQGLAAPELLAGTTRWVASAAVGRPAAAGGPGTAFDVTYTLLPLLADGSFDAAATPAVVYARYVFLGPTVSVAMELEPAPALSTAALLANCSVPLEFFPWFANSSSPQGAPGPPSPTRLWSLRNWLEGGHATVQVDYRDGLALTYGSDGNASQWLLQSAGAGAATLAFQMTLFAAGQAPYGADEPVTLEGPLRRAGGYLAQQWINDSRRILTDWAFGKYPWVRESSGLAQERFANSSEMPDTRAGAIEWMRANVQYVVVVNSTDDLALQRFPELGGGDSDANFSLVLHDRGPSSAAGEPDLWVYRVNRGDGAMALWPTASLRFWAAAGRESATIGLDVILNGTALASPGLGIAVPEVYTNGTRYEADFVTFQFVAGSAGREVTARFSLLPQQGNGSLGGLPIIVNATYRLNGTLLGVNFTVDEATVEAPFVLRALTQLNASAFPVFANDTNWTQETQPSPQVPLFSLRNWLIAPGMIAVQVDYRDPLLLHYEREAAGNVTIVYEAPPDMPSFDFEVRVIPPEMVPTQ